MAKRKVVKKRPRAKKSKTKKKKVIRRNKPGIKKSKAKVVRRPKVNKKLSKASKKGWRTRRSKQQKQVVERILSSEEKSALRKKYREKVDIANKAILDAKSVGVDISRWVDDIPYGFLKADGTIAYQYSSLRALLTDEQKRKLNDRLFDAEWSGNLDLEVIEISVQIGISAREIYTFYYSP